VGGGGGAADFLMGVESTLTQSGSVVSVKGLVGRYGFGIVPGSGMTVDFAGRPLLSHHFCFSELGRGTARTCLAIVDLEERERRHTPRRQRLKVEEIILIIQ